MTYQLSTDIRATAKLGTLSETKMRCEKGKMHSTPLGLGQSLGGIHNGTRRQHSAIATAQLYTTPPN